MSVKISKIVFYFTLISLFAMSFPYLFDLSNDVFKKDFYAKRIMTIITLPFFLLFFYISLQKARNINQKVLYYLLSVVIVIINAFIYGNKISLIILDTFILLLPVFFYLLVYKTNFDKDLFIEKFPLILLIASILILLNVKLQFSYLTMLAILYIIFFSKPNYWLIILLLTLPFLSLKTLIGKSSLLMLIALFIYLLFFNKTVTKKRKTIIITSIGILSITAVSIFWNFFTQTDAYNKMIYFYNNADFSKLEFKDMSTGHRLYEAKQILHVFKEENLYKKIFGNGPGATIDLSQTMDVSVKRVHKGHLKEVRHIHIGLFAVLHRYGLLGVFIFFYFIKKLFIASKIVLKNTNDYRWILITLYTLMIIFDSFVTFPHMMSNFIFWLFAFMILKKRDEIINQQYAIS